MKTTMYLPPFSICPKRSNLSRLKLYLVICTTNFIPLINQYLLSLTFWVKDCKNSVGTTTQRNLIGLTFIKVFFEVRFEGLFDTTHTKTHFKMYYKMRTSYSMQTILLIYSADKRFLDSNSRVSQNIKQLVHFFKVHHLDLSANKIKLSFFAKLQRMC